MPNLIDANGYLSNGKTIGFNNLNEIFDAIN